MCGILYLLPLCGLFKSERHLHGLFIYKSEQIFSFA